MRLLLERSSAVRSGRKSGLSLLQRWYTSSPQPAPSPFKDSLLLPKTSFPLHFSIVDREAKLRAVCASRELYDRQLQRAGASLYILHDGPPYANGKLHMGHALNKILKDIVVRHRILQGDAVHFVPGWDCHGLPIELKALGNSLTKHADLPPPKLRHRAKQFALEAVEHQKKDFMSWGVLADWPHPYLTLAPEYEASQLRVFLDMFRKGLIYRGLKPVYWSPSTQTALAEAELEYVDDHVSHACYVKFNAGEGAKQKLLDAAGLSALSRLPLGVSIWTTTPWTLPANQAICLHKSLEYSLVHLPARDSGPEELVLIGTSLVAPLLSLLGLEPQQAPTVGALLGAQLEAMRIECQHPLTPSRSVPLIHGDHVTSDAGTGLVHTAPAHGVDDFIVCKKHGIPLLTLVDSHGKYTSEAGPELAGHSVLSSGMSVVLDKLRANRALLHTAPYKHRYPYDWRSKQPVITMATKQWFIRLTDIKGAAIDAVSRVSLFPPVSRNRLEAMLSGRDDWCISRQRSWGVPIPVFYHVETDEPLLSEEVAAHIIALVQEHGTDHWFARSEKELLPPSYADRAHLYRKGTDTMDVWFDSGTSWTSLPKTGAGLADIRIADLYLEGSDQHRGWFQSSLLTSIATRGTAPYKNIVTHGFVLDALGRKMSKSLGNVIEPSLVVVGGKGPVLASRAQDAVPTDARSQQAPPTPQSSKKQSAANAPAAGEAWSAYGADVLRYWAASTDYSADVAIGHPLIKTLAANLKRIRNMNRFMLGGVWDFSPKSHGVPFSELPPIDRLLVFRLDELASLVAKSYDSFAFLRVCSAVFTFYNNELSSFYFEIVKDRLYADAPGSFSRRAAQTVLSHALDVLTKALAPITCHASEDVWIHLSSQRKFAEQAKHALGQQQPVAQAVQLSIPSDGEALGGAHASLLESGPLSQHQQLWRREGLGQTTSFGQLSQTWEAVMALRTQVNKAIEAARADKQVGSSTDADVWLTLAPAVHKTLADFFTRPEARGNEEHANREIARQLSDILVVSQTFLAVERGAADVLANASGGLAESVGVVVKRAQLSKCPRCWRHLSTQPDALCHRCEEVMKL